MNDQAFSSVVATILMVSLTILLAIAGHFIINDTTRTPSISETRYNAMGLDQDDNHQVETILLKLQEGPEGYRTVYRLTYGDHVATLEGASDRLRMLPCLGEGMHQITVTTQGETVADLSLSCGESWYPSVSFDEKHDGEDEDCEVIFMDACLNLDDK